MPKGATLFMLNAYFSNFTLQNDGRYIRISQLQQQYAINRFDLYKQMKYSNKKINQNKKHKILVNKVSSIVKCSECSFFPSQQQLKECMRNQSIFEMEWSCIYCKKNNVLGSDQQFRYYCYGDQIVIDQSEQKNQTMILIEMSQEMSQNYLNLSNTNTEGSKKNSQFSKKQLMQQSNLLLTYLEAQALRVRKNRGINFSWQQFTKQKNLTKIQFALWLTDYIRNNLSNTSFGFFVPLLNHQKENYNNQNKHILFKQFFHRYKTKNNQQFQILYNDSVKQCIIEKQTVIISSSCLGSLYSHVLKCQSKTKTYIINLEQRIDAINLTGTSTNTYLNCINLLGSTPLSQIFSNQSLSNAHKKTNKTYINIQEDVIQAQQKNIQILDNRIRESQNLKQFANFLLQYLLTDHSYFTLFVKKQTSAKSNLSLNSLRNNNLAIGTSLTVPQIPKQHKWEKVSDMNTFREQIKKKYKQKIANTPLSALFTGQKLKISHSMIQFMHFLKNRHQSKLYQYRSHEPGLVVDKLGIKPFLNTVSSVLGKQQFKLIVNIHNYISKFTILWSSDTTKNKKEKDRSITINNTVWNVATTDFKYQQLVNVVSNYSQTQSDENEQMLYQFNSSSLKCDICQYYQEEYNRNKLINLQSLVQDK